MQPQFLIWAPAFTHRSSGIRALYRLCHHLNCSGYSAAITSPSAETPTSWQCPSHEGPVGDSFVIYPEVISGNPLGASKVIRWVLHNPGLLGGDKRYDDAEMVFVYDHQKLAIAQESTSQKLGPDRVLWTGLVDPGIIYPDPLTPKTIDCSFTHKGRKLSERFDLPHADIIPLETLTPTFDDLGETLRRTRVLYSYDHYSNVLREAVICGCDVRVIDELGQWHDPRTCHCAGNIIWQDDLMTSYADRFNDSRFIQAFIDVIETQWPVRRPEPPRGSIFRRLRKLFSSSQN